MHVSQWNRAKAVEFLPVPDAAAHKYSRGVLGLRTGSTAYPGAAVLSAEAAWRTGIGMVCYVSVLDDAPPQFGLPSPAAAILTHRPETVFAADTPEIRSRCDAWVIGCGTDASLRNPAESTALLDLLAGDAPVVVDAGALDLVARKRPGAPTIITPHLGEFQSLWSTAGLGELALSNSETPAEKHIAERATAAATLAEALGVTVLLKGSYTVIASAGGEAISYGPATPWLATAGTGDVLAGALGTLVAAHAEAVRADLTLLTRIAATAVVLHDHAASTASAQPLTALDVAHCLSAAHRELRTLSD